MTSKNSQVEQLVRSMHSHGDNIDDREKALRIAIKSRNRSFASCAFSVFSLIFALWANDYL